MPRVLRSTLAAQDLVEIWQHVARDNRTAADHLIDTVAEKCCLLASSPELGEKRPELGLDLRSFVVGNYVVLYRPMTDGIEVARVIHSARDIDALL
jgi:toxin ParE1/3/4